MRTIKFRAWDTGWKRMIQWDDLKFENNLASLQYSTGHVYEQFTGLHDKNGREIFEGDIFRSEVHGEELREVLFQEGGFRGRLLGNRGAWHMGTFPPGIEVIGNRWENPELLKSTPPLLAGEGKGKGGV